MKKDQDKTKEQLITELKEMRQRVRELEASDTEPKQAEMPSLSSNEYRRLFELSPMGITILDMKGIIIECNAAVYSNSGYSRDDFVGKHFSKITDVRVGNIPKFIKVFASLTRGKVPKPFEVIYTRKDGTTGWTELHISLLKSNGKTMGIQVLQNDITERKQAEEALRESQEKHRAIFEQAADSIVLIDAKTGALVEFNERACQHLGYSREELEKLKISDFEVIESAGEVTKHIEKIVKGRSDLFETQHRTKSGEIRDIQVNSKAIRTGGRDFIQSIWRDITEHKRANEELRESENEIRAIADNVPGLVLYVDSGGYYRFANKRFEEWFSIQSEEVIGRHYRKILGEAAYEKIKDYVDEVLTGHAVSFEEEVPYALGGIRWVMARYIPDFSDDGKVKGFFALVTDISERKQAEEALLESEERYRSLVNLGGAVGEAIVMLQDTEQGDAIQTFVNREWPRITGYSKEELLGMSFFDLLHPKYRAASLERHKRKISGEAVPQLFEMSIIRKDGTEVPIELTSAYTTYKGEHAHVAFIRDITERKQTEENLQEAVERFRRLFEQSNDAVFIHDLEGKLLDVNSKACDMLGYDKDTLLKVLIPALHPEEELPASKKALQTTMETGSIRFESKFKKADGTIIDVDISSSLIDPEGGIVQGIVRDITEHKQAERRIKDLAKFPDENPNPVLRVAKDGAILYANEASLSLLDVWKGHVSKPLPAPWHKFVLDALSSGSIKTVEVESQDRILAITFSAVPETDYVNLYGIDITERKRMEEKEKQLNQELNLASRLATVGTMSAGIAHEIYNPLTGVIGFSSLLLKKDLPEDIKEYVEIIYKGGKQVASITERMLTFARQYRPKRTSVNINEIIESTLAMRAYEMKSSNIQVETRLDPDLPITTADAGQLQQVFLNIILNAEMEMKSVHGRGNLTVKTQRIDNTIRVSFKDDGPGMPKKNLGKLFDPFFTTRDPDKGTGLGLSICYSIVTQHGGKIYVQSRLGKGATFFVELPIVTKEKQLKMAEPAAEASKTLSRARILVVDDDTIVQEFLAEVLGKEGYEVEIVGNGDDALDRLGNEDYDVILLDIKLPGMSGIELYRYIQKTVRSLGRRVIFITGDMMSKDTMAFLSRTKAPYITKPFDAERLKEDINRILTEGA